MSFGTYKGRDVIQTSVSIRNAGDGLSKALGIEPREFSPGETVMVLLECEWNGETHQPIKDTDAFQLVTILRASTATLVDTAQARKALDQQARKNQRAAEEAAGVQRIPGVDPDEDENEDPDGEGDD